MKTLKKLMAVSLTAALLMSLFVTAFAATSIEIIEPSEYASIHEYDVYQIFTGTLSDGKLSNVKYGANYGRTNSPVPKTELDAISSDGGDPARDFADNLMANNHALLHNDPVVVLSKTNSFKADVAPGYYLIVDRSTVNPMSDGDILSQYIVQVLDEVSMSPKKDLVSSSKVISSDAHTEDSPANPGVRNDGKVDNVSIGDTVNFTITNKVPLNATTYDYFYFIVNDKLSDGLDLVNSAGSSIKVYVSSDGIVDSKDSVLTETTDYAVYTGTDAGDNTFKVALTHAKDYAGSYVIVTYQATLNKNAVIGSDGNLNTESLTYSNDPNKDYDGSKDENKPGLPKSDTTVPLGETPKETTKTYTSGIKIQKLDQDLMALAGAGFTITGKSSNVIVRNSDTFTQDNANGTYYKLKSGAYTTDAPQTTEYMKKQTGSEGYVIASDSDAIKDTDKTIGGVRYRVVNDGETAQYILMQPNTELYESTTDKYVKSHTTTTETTTEDNGTMTTTNLMVNSDGTLELSGLGAGTYTIEETTVPSGYTAAKPVTVVITFDNDSQTFSATVNGTAVTADSTTDLFPVDIQNIAGNQLPETGGIGTKIFYALGAVLVIGAGVVLVSRKRALD